MGSELTYRGHEPQPSPDSYSPKPIKPWPAVTRVVRYMLKEQRLVFVLVGIAIATVVFALLPSTRASSGRVTDAYSVSESVGMMNPRRSVYRTEFDSFNLGGKIPLGLKRKGLRIVVTGGAGFVGSHLVDRLIARGDSVIVVGYGPY